ncbi:MAG: HD domain-containing protein, partial [Kangiellaceae bacterium]|nr:HD domain-containing protein [Kangiellaceae bacterium]
RQGRTDDSLKLCEALNQEAGNLVDAQQLRAAVYIHDIGMAFIPAKILNKEGKLSREELIVVKSHIQVGADLLSSIPGWQAASDMVQQHHERFDGSGYPKGLNGKQINPGAMILALADTYLAVTNERSDRSYKRNLFSAVTLINGESGGQFDPELVEVFNETIRKLYLSPS